MPIDSVYDFSPKALVEVKSWLEPWFLTRCPCASGPAATLPFPTQVAALSATRNLLGYWRLGDGASPFLDTSGNAAGPNNLVQTVTGTAMNDNVTGALPVADDDGAVQFNVMGAVAGDYLSSSAVSLFAGTSGTVALWVKPMGSPSGTQYVIGSQDNSNGGWELGLSGTSVFFSRATLSGGATATGPSIPVGRWTFVAVEWSSSSGVRIYFGGRLVYSDSVVQSAAATSSLFVGRRNPASGGAQNAFQGGVDEASIWGDRLSADEIATLAASGGLATDPTARAVINTSVAYTAFPGDVVLANGTFTVTLPTVVGNSGAEITVKNVSGAGTITVHGAGSETIDGSATVTLAAGKAVTIVSDGTAWYAIGGY